MHVLSDNFRKKHPARNANIFSLLTFSYMMPIFRRTCRKGLTEDDLFDPLPDHKSSVLGDKLEGIWKEAYRKHKKAALHIALCRMFGVHFVLLGLVKLVNEIMLVVGFPWLVRKLIKYFEEKQDEVSTNDAYLYLGGLVLMFVINTFCGHNVMMGLAHITMKLRLSCSSLVYRKTLKLSRTALGSTTVGQLVNLLSNDVSKFEQGFILAHFMWVGPIQTAVGVYLIYLEIGQAAFFGILFLLSFIPMQIWMGKRTSHLRLKTALRTDERVRLMNEIISGIQVIKMYCWEKPFAKLVEYVRRQEMRAIRSHAYLLGVVFSFEGFVTRASIFISTIGYALLGNTVTAEKVFAVTAVYNVMRPVITTLFSISISSVAEVNVSLNRIQKFLVSDEREDLGSFMQQNLADGYHKIKIVESETKNVDSEKNGVMAKPKIVLQNLNAKWNSKDEENTLENINLNVSDNSLVAVIGPVGSGKSSLINTLLKELTVSAGSMNIAGTISYASQEPWLFTGSVRQNILFGEDYNEERYKDVIQVCALQSDFDMFPFGDKTLVGEKGKALSGGQKARINLARCVYKQADIYLLDDPLSAVDAHVGKHLFEECIKKYLSGKIRVLITHQLQYLKKTDHIILMKDGSMQIQGTYRELQGSGLDFTKLMQEFQTEEEEKEKKKMKSRQNSEVELEEDEEGPQEDKEQLGSGSVSSSVYWKYISSGGSNFVIFVLVLSFIVSQLFGNLGDYFSTYWVNLEQDYAEKVALNYTNATIDRDYIIYVYTGIILATIIFSLFHSLFFMYFFIQSSINLHHVVFSKIITATMNFFNSNPSGRILNRFSKDMGYMDESIPFILFDVVEIALFLIGVVALAAVVEPWLLLPSVVLVTLFYFLRNIYIKTSRSVKRLEGISRSPIFGHMTASMHGLSTIRAFNAQHLVIEEFDKFQDVHSAPWFLFLASNRCFGFWLDMICSLFITLASLCLILFGKGLHGGDVGLVLTQFIGLISSLQWGMRQWSELENHMTSVERILEYTKAETEPKRPEAKNLPLDWPSSGKLEFRDVCLRYNENEPYVLKHLNFTIKPKEKVGIVGRTGAGKSSTISVLFQLYEMDGSILLDEIDTTKLPLDKIRSKISIIPQEPVLFSGTMRRNLDPFEEYNDDVLWNALEQVELKETIAELAAGLNTAVSEGGTNFSVGQRQLVCLARALIRNNKVLVLDEATANVDPHTDALIQKTIRDKFADCTVLTIAHRLNTVMDSDKILVMNAGRVEEFEHPHVLLQQEGGFFHSLVEATGRSTSKMLGEVAKEAYEKKLK